MVKKVITSALLNLGLTQMIFQPNHAVAQDNYCETPCCLSVVPGDVIETGCLNAGYLLPAAYAPQCSWDFYASGDFLYLGYSEDVTPPAAQRYTFVDGFDFHVNRTTKNLMYSSPYRPGFRVSAGVDLDNVLLDATYMRYHSTVHNHFDAGVNAGLAITNAAGGILAPNNGQPTLFQTLSASRTINVDRLLVTLQTPVYLGKRMLMNLNFGLLTYWNEQKLRFDGTALDAPPDGVLTSTGFTTARHKGWAVGPDLGFKAVALLPWSFQGLFNVDLSLLYAEVTHGQTVVSFPIPDALPLAQATNNTTLSRQKAGAWQAVQSAEIGLGWGGYFWCDKYHVNLYATYNFISQYLLTEGVPYSDTAYDTYFLSYSLHGIAIGARLDF